MGTGLWRRQTREQGRACLWFSAVPPSAGTALGTKELLKKRVMRERVLPVVRGDDWMESPLAGNHSPAAPQRGAASQLWLQGATATLPTEPEPSTHAPQPPSHRREETRHHCQEPRRTPSAERDDGRLAPPRGCGSPGPGGPPRKGVGLGALHGPH